MGTTNNIGYIHNTSLHFEDTNHFLDFIYDVLDDSVSNVVNIVGFNFINGLDKVEIYDKVEMGEDEIFLEKVEKIKEIISKHEMRIFFITPKNYNLSNIQESNGKVESLLLDLSLLLECLDIFTPSIILRVGPTHGNKKDTISGCSKSIMGFPMGIRKKLVVTNDDKPSLYSVTDLLSHIYFETKIPICFRFLPHQFNSGNLSPREALMLSVSTWPENCKPIFIHSESSSIDENGYHVKTTPSKYLTHRIPTFNIDTDIMVDTSSGLEGCVKYKFEKMTLKPMVINKISN